MRNSVLVISILALTIASCETDSPNGNTDSFNRKEVVENMTNNLILPSYSDLNTEMREFVGAWNTYKTSGSSQDLENLRSEFEDAYIAWQEAALWSFGPAEDEGLLTVMNIYPVDTQQVEINLQGSFDLNSISNFDAQGFPALEYLLYRDHNDLSDANTASYFDAVLNRMMSKTTAVENAWNNGYSETFINAEGTDRGSAMGLLFNYTLLPYMEVHQREAKFGIPGGQRTGTAAPSKVEARFARTLSKELAFSAFQSYRRAWLGLGHIDHNAGPSLIDYVKFIDDRNGTSLSGKVQSQLDDIQLAIEGLDDDFYSIAQNDPQQLNNVWTKYQMLVFTVKTEVSSALNVTISYVDSDGD